MPLVVRNSLIKSLPSSVTIALGKMPEEDQAIFEEDYQRKRRSAGLMLFLALFFPIQLFLEGRVGLGLIFLVTIGGFGIWYIIDIFLILGRTRTHNEEAAKRIIRDMKIIGS